ncbi:MAG: STAS domain-containing protein [Bacteroidia bacterium]|nr:STAS domain-containing protein [Bacteroidia bacterium]
MLEFNYNTEEKVITLAFTGRMDTLAVAKLSEMIGAEPLMQNWKPEEKMVFDVKEVDYIASSFIRICVSYAKQAGLGRFSMVNCQPFVKKTFKISGLDEVLNIT